MQHGDEEHGHWSQSDLGLNSISATFLDEFIPSFSKYLLSIDFVPGTVLDPRDSAMNKTNSCFPEAYIPVGEADYKYMNKTIKKIISDCTLMKKKQGNGK